MAAAYFTFFPTAIGHCSIVWSDQGLRALALPAASIARARSSINERFPDARESEPPAEIAQVMRGVVNLLEGGHPDFSRVSLDVTGIPGFHQRVYALTRRIPPGHTVSYGEIATRLGNPGAARAVGQALGRNPWALIVPCHRVVAANGRLTGFSAHGGVHTKRKLLAIEGLSVDRG